MIKYMTVITIAIFVFEIIPPLNVVRLILNSTIDKVIIKMSVRRMIVSLPTLLYGSLSTSALAMISTITPGKTDIIGIKKVNVSRRHPNVKMVPVTSPSKFIFSFKFSYDVTVDSPAVSPNVCVSAVTRFRSRILFRETKRWFYKNTKI